jgi:UDP-glucose 4-epimerase
MMQSVLITGGMGFLGGRVAQLLHSDDRLSIKLGSRQSQGQLEWLPGVEVLTMEWESSSSLALVCEGVDVLIHLAGLNAEECLADPIAAFNVNVINTARLMEAARLAGVKRVIYFSTAHVYSRKMNGKIDESVLTKNFHPYASSHRAAEDIVFSTCDFGIEAVALRLSNGFGAPAHPSVNAWTLLVNDLCRQAVYSGHIRLRSSGLQCRDFITLEDVARVVLHMVHLPRSELSDGLFNVGSGRSSTVNEMVELIQERCAKVLGHTPILTRGVECLGDSILNFDYRCDKLFSTGFALQGNAEQEVDNILKLCTLTRRPQAERGAFI